MPNTSADRRPPFSIPEAAQYLGVSPRFVRRLVDERRVPFLKLGALVRLRADDLDAFMDRALIEPRPVERNAS